MSVYDYASIHDSASNNSLIAEETVPIWWLIMARVRFRDNYLHDNVITIIIIVVIIIISMIIVRIIIIRLHES